MSKKIIIDANFPNETRVVLLNSSNNIEDIEYETANKLQNKGNIYLAKITRIEPSLQAAFIDYGTDKSGFISFSEIHPNYYHIPISDQKSSINNLKEITPPKITQDDLTESKLASNSIIQVENELGIKDIERLVDEKILSDYNLEVAESDIENINSDKNDVSSNKHYKIQEVVKKGQVVLVQVTKEERGNKGASFTTFISLAGKYCILMPNKPSQNGISRKISNVEERKRLKDIISQLTSDLDQGSASIIARTAAVGHTTLELKRDYDYLARLWNKIREATLQSNAPCFIHEEEGIIQKTIRDMFDNNVKEMTIQGEKAFQAAHKFMREILPTEIAKIKDYENKIPIFTKFNIEDQLSSLYQPV
ncbi:MAG: ribonuclease E/G, partial [Janthinobacterium lividum]